MSSVGFPGDLDVLVADFGVPVVFAGAPAGLLGIEDVAGLDVFAVTELPRVSATDRTVLVKTSALAAFGGIDAALTVDGVAYVARDVLLAPPDGAYTVIALQNA